MLKGDQKKTKKKAKKQLGTSRNFQGKSATLDHVGCVY
jgi:hypothetical protein